MSLIEEALRRVQPGTTARPEAGPAESAAAQEERIRRVQVPVTNNRWVAWIGGGFAISVLALAALTRLLRPIEAVRPPAIATPAPGVADASLGSAARTMVKPAPEPGPILQRRSQPPQPPELKLNGVVEGVGEPFAIINGSIVRLGESVAGATLIAVDRDNARLRWMDQELRLRTE